MSDLTLAWMPGAATVLLVRFVIDVVCGAKK